MSSDKRRRQRGFTLTELMVSAVVLSILVLSVMPVLRLSQQGFSSMEARNSLKTEGQAAVNRMGHKLTECKRMFENTALDNAFFTRATLSVAPMTGSQLAIMEESGAVSPSSGSFVAASVGNRLFFASVVPAADSTVLITGGTTAVVRVDLYQFNAYYLALDNTKRVAGSTRRVLREWHSASYADYNQLIASADAIKRANTARAMVNTHKVYFAWNPTSTVANTAFYSINGTSGALAVVAAHTIDQASSGEMMKVNAGLTLGGYRYGVSPNSTSTSNVVPQFGIASSNFPSGFEIVIVGPNSARQVFMRMVLAAEGSFPGIITSEQVLLTTVRDLY